MAPLTRARPKIPSLLHFYPTLQPGTQHSPWPTSRSCVASSPGHTPMNSVGTPGLMGDHQEWMVQAELDMQDAV